MNRTRPPSIALALLFTAFLPVAPADAASPTALVVHWKDGPASPAALAAKARTGARVLRDFPNVGWQLVELPAAVSPSAALRLYSSLDGVLAAELDAKIPARRRPIPAVEPTRLTAPAAALASAATPSITPSDPSFSKQWYLRTIHAPQAWATTTGSTNVVVAVIDTGIDYNHPDLAPNMWRNPGETGLDANGRDRATNGIDDDGNGYIDDVFGADVTTGSGDPIDTGFVWPPNVPEGSPGYEGTWNAGIIGAVGNNRTGIAGVSWSVRMMAIKGYTGDATKPGPAYLQFSSAIAAWDYILGMKRRGENIRVTSDGIGSTASFPALREVVTEAVAEGILPIAPAGNDGLNKDLDSRFDSQVYNAPVLAVTGSSQSDTLLDYSDFGASTVHLAAPAENFFTTVRGGGYIASVSGSSKAASQVAGTAALLLAVRPELSVDELKGAILGSVDQSPTFRGKLISGGRLNVARAIQSLTNDNPTAIVVSALPAGPRAIPTSPIEIHFNRPMNPVSMEQSLVITPPLEGRFEWAPGHRALKFIHDAPFDRSATYTVRLLGSAQDESGGTLDGNFNGVREGSPTDDYVFRFHFPVSNDNFADAAELSGPSGSTNGTTRSTIFEWDRHEPIPMSFFDPNTVMFVGSVWYRWTAPAPAAWYTFDLTSGTSFDSYLAVYRGDSPSTLVSVAADDNYGGRQTSRVSFPADPMVRYSIAVLTRNGASADTSGPLRLSWYATPPPGFTGSQFTPPSAAPGAKVTLLGTNFAGATAVLFGGHEVSPGNGGLPIIHGAASASFSNAASNNLDLRITAIVPTDATSGPITVITPHGNVTSTATFRVLPPPLSIVHMVDGRIEVRWPATSDAIILETSVDLGRSEWLPVAASPSRVDGKSSVMLPPAAAGYYRLRAD